DTPEWAPCSETGESRADDYALRLPPSSPSDSAPRDDENLPQDARREGRAGDAYASEPRYSCCRHRGYWQRAIPLQPGRDRPEYSRVAKDHPWVHATDCLPEVLS